MGVFLLLLLSFVFSYKEKNTNGTVIIEIKPVSAFPVTISDEAGNILAIADAPEIKLVLKKGSHNLSFKSEDSYYSEEQRIITLDSNKKSATKITLKGDQKEQSEAFLNNIQVSDPTISNSSQTDPFQSVDKSTIAKDIEYFENNTWASATLVTTKDATDGEKIVIKYNQTTSSWDTVYAGTSLTLKDLLESGIPENVALEMVL